MANENGGRLPHIFIKDTATADRYTRPPRGRDAKYKLPYRNRRDHAKHLLGQLEKIEDEELSFVSEQKDAGFDVSHGIYISFESEADFDLKFTSLEFQPSGIELCSIRNVGNKTVATVFVPEGRLSYFWNKIVQYRDNDTSTGKPRNKDLIESISAIRVAVLEALWTDDVELFPETNSNFWWEVWLRRSKKEDYEDHVRQHADKVNLKVSREVIRFLDRTILLIRATREQIASSIFLLGAIAELRSAKETADFFTGMDKVEQQQWIDEALQRLKTPLPDGVPNICILDSGVTENHPILKPVADAADMHAYNPAWGTDDRIGHGTQMAGLAIYGDLTQVLASADPIEITHRLESVKVIPNSNYQNVRFPYGAVTRESINRVEVNSGKKRVYTMAVSTTDGRDRGRPSSWSAAIDALTSGYDDEERRLVILSAGNTDSRSRHKFPDSNFTDAIHDPGQAWNALTVGAFTEKPPAPGKCRRPPAPKEHIRDEDKFPKARLVKYLYDAPDEDRLFNGD